MWRLGAALRELVSFLSFLLWLLFGLALILTAAVGMWLASNGSLEGLWKGLAALDTSQRLQLGGTVFVIATLVIAWRNLRHNRRIAILNKRADVIQHCAKRYDDLYRERGDIASQKAARYWYSRMWGLKSDQLDFYLAGWVDLDTLRSWIYSTYAMIARDEPFEISGVTLHDSWDKAAPYHRDANPMFYEMMALFFAAYARDPDETIAAPLCDAVLLQLDRKSRGEREMVQRRYGIREYLGKIKKLTVFDLDEAMAYVARHRKSYARGAIGR